jgi:hypothetical protein
MARFQQALTDPRRGGWPRGRLTTYLDRADIGLVASEMRRLTQEATDALLVYYVGHGLLDPTGKLCLTFSATRADEAEITGLPYSWLADTIRDSPAKIKAVILDCCFSGAATDVLSDAEAIIASTTAIDGTYTLAATERTTTAKTPPAERRSAPTSFTGELLDMVGQGVVDGPAHLTLDYLFPLLRQRLREKGLPTPTARVTNTAGQFILASNVSAAWSQQPGALPPRTARIVIPEKPRRPRPRPAPISQRASMADSRRGLIIALIAVIVAICVLIYSAMHDGEPYERPESDSSSIVGVWPEGLPANASRADQP